MDTLKARIELVKELRRKGIKDERVLKAIGETPRHLFLPPELSHAAYADEALPIGYRQTISQPYVVALMTQSLALQWQEKVLDIGTGSGYQAAILALLCAEVVTIEVVPELSAEARRRLETLGINNVQFLIGDGGKGALDEAPFDGVIVAAAAPYTPQPLIDQLAENGRLVIPIGSREDQELTLIKKVGAELRSANLGLVRFVPLIGRYGFTDPNML